jgi:hypothetical protein
MQAPTKKRRKITKAEAGQFARMYAASVVASAEDFDFQDMLPGESELLAEALLIVSNRLHQGPTFGRAGEIFAHVLASRTK